MRYDLTDLRLFLAVVESGSISAGAERCHLALASASARIKGMEDVLGVPLLTRTRRGVDATVAGRTLTVHARQMVRQMEQLMGDLSAYGQGMAGQITVMGNTAAMGAPLPALLGRFLADFPQMDVCLVERTSTEVVKAVWTGEAHMGIATDSVVHDGVDHIFFRHDRLMVAMPRDHALTHRPSVTLADLSDQAMVGLPADSALSAYLSGQADRQGVVLRHRVQVRRLDAVLPMVAAGAGIAIIPDDDTRSESQIRDGIVVLRPLADGWASRRLVICTKRQSSPHPPAISHLISLLTAASVEE